MKKKWIAPLTIALAAMMSISACSSAKSESAQDRNVENVKPQVHNSDSKNTVDFAEPEVAYDESFDGVAQEGAATAPDALGVIKSPNNKIIYTAEIDIKVEEADAAMDSISQAAVMAGGYVSASNFFNYDEERSGIVTVRIPPDKLTEFSDLVGSLGEIESSNLQSQDVTEEYIDIESRLKNAKAQEVQLLAIMEKAIEIEDILIVRTELNYVQQEIEQYEGRLRYLDSAVDYSTVTVRIYEKEAPYEPVVDPDEDVIKRYSFKYVRDRIEKGIKNSFAGTINVLASILIGISSIVIPLLIFILPIIILIVIIRIRSKKRRKSKIAATATQATAKKEFSSVAAEKTEPTTEATSNEKQNN